MKTQIRSLLTLACAVSASLFLIGSPAQAGYIVTLEQVGSNVVATGSGPIDLTGLSPFGSIIGEPSVVIPNTGVILTGPTPGSTAEYAGAPINGPTNFGSGFPRDANSGSGDFVGIDGALFVPLGYVSDSPLSDRSTYDSATFSSLGVTPGTYEWTWGTGGVNQNFTLKIGAAAVPDQGSSLTLLGIVLLCWLGFDLARSRVVKV